MSSIYEKFDFSTLNCVCHYNLDLTTSMISNKLIVNGKINCSFSRKMFIEANGLVELLESVMYHSSFLDQDSSFIEKLFCVYNKILVYPKCKKCGKSSKHFNGNFTNGYYSKFCSRSCNGSVNYPKKNVGNKLWEKSKKKIKITTSRQRSAGLSKEWKQKLSKAANKKEVKDKKKNTCLLRYGVSNPGVLGAYHSKAAFIYIVDFLSKKGIDQNRCYFYDYNNKNKKEFFQIIYVPFLDKKKFFSYDLVVFRDIESANVKNTSQIEMVFEYNGPWHYRTMKGLDAQSPAVPYIKDNTYKWTKKDVFKLDKIKIERACSISNSVMIYWMEEDFMETIK